MAKFSDLPAASDWNNVTSSNDFASRSLYNHQSKKTKASVSYPDCQGVLMHTVLYI